MSVNARTYQVIHAIRKLVLAGKNTSQTDIGDYFRDAKNADKENFGRAYLSPSTLQGILIRLVAEDEYLSYYNSVYHLTPGGSILADMLDKIDEDTNSNGFILNYKSYVVRSYLASLNVAKPVVTPQNVAEGTGLSRDSARRGLSELLMEGFVKRNGPLYRVTTEFATDEIDLPEDALSVLLENLDESPLMPEIPEIMSNPTTLGDLLGLAETTKPSPLIACPKPGISNPILTEQESQTTETTEDAPDEMDECVEGLNGGSEKWSAVTEWSAVPVYLQLRFIARADAMAMTLDEYMEALDDFYVAKALEVFLPPRD